MTQTHRQQSPQGSGQRDERERDHEGYETHGADWRERARHRYPGAQQQMGSYSVGYRSPQYGSGEHGFDDDFPVDTGRYSAGQYGIPAEPRDRRGPKGYARSDARVREDICERLMSDPSIDVSSVGVDVQNGKVMLEGSVPERRMKHVIEDIADACFGVKDIDNRVRVDASHERDLQAATARRNGDGGRGCASSIEPAVHKNKAS